MVSLLEDDSMGNGEILEVLHKKTRIVPLYNADPPSGEGMSTGNYEKVQDRLLASLRKGYINA